MKYYIILFTSCFLICLGFITIFSFSIYSILNKTIEIIQYWGEEYQEYLDYKEETLLKQQLLTSFNEYLEENKEAESWDVFLEQQENIRKQQENIKNSREHHQQSSDEFNRPYYDFGCPRAGYNSFMKHWECLE